MVWPLLTHERISRYERVTEDDTPRKFTIDNLKRIAEFRH
jgi:hypothetical protein